MRKLLISSTVALVLGSTASSAFAADSATLAVTGVITPATCDIALSQPTVEFGNIAASTLTNSANTITGSSTVLSIDCDAASTVAIQTTDNRSASALTIAEMADAMDITSTTISDSNSFGLGLDSADSKVGSMVLAVSSATADTVTNNNLLHSTDKTNWEVTQNVFSLEKEGYLALSSSSSSTAPISLTNATFDITPVIMLKNADQYPSGEQVNIDGNVTFSLVYL